MRLCVKSEVTKISLSTFGFAGTLYSLLREYTLKHELVWDDKKSEVFITF